MKLDLSLMSFYGSCWLLTQATNNPPFIDPVVQDPALSPHRLRNIVTSYQFKNRFNIIFTFMHSSSR